MAEYRYIDPNEPPDLERYGRTETILRKYAGVTDPEIIEAAKQTEHDWRERTRMAFISDEESGGRGTFATMMNDRPGTPSEICAISVFHHTPEGRVRDGKVEIPRSIIAEKGYKNSLIEHIRAASPGEELDKRTWDTIDLETLSPFSSTWATRAANRAFSLTCAIEDVFAEKNRRNGHVDKNLFRFRKAFQPMTVRFEHRRIRSLLFRFTASLDPEAVKIMRQIAYFKPEFYNWLTADGNAQTAMKRKQAARSYPILASIMIGNKKLTNVIDQGQPLAPALAEHFSYGTMFYSPDGLNDSYRNSCSDKTIKRLNGVHWQRAGRLAVMQTENVLRWIGATPKNWMPHSRKDWAAFHVTQENLDSYVPFSGKSRADITRETRGEWQKMAAVFADNPAMTLRDMANDLYKRLFLPTLAERYSRAIEEADSGKPGKNEIHASMDPISQAEKIIMKEIVGDKSILKVMDLNARWHRGIAHLDEQLCTVLRDENWPALSDPQTHQGLLIRPLTMAQELRSEGARMNHCVGGYTSSCAYGNSHILSIAEADGKALSTVELQETNDPKNPLKIRQHYGYRNTPPGPHADKAIKWYMNQIRKGEIAVDWEHIEKTRRSAKSNKSGNRILRQIGFDPRDGARREMAFEAYKEFLPKSARDMNLDTWLKKTGLDDIIEQRIEKLHASISKSRPATQPKKQRRDEPDANFGREPLRRAPEQDPGLIARGMETVAEVFGRAAGAER